MPCIAGMLARSSLYQLRPCVSLQLQLCQWNPCRSTASKLAQKGSSPLTPAPPLEGLVGLVSTLAFILAFAFAESSWNRKRVGVGPSVPSTAEGGLLPRRNGLNLDGLFPMPPATRARQDANLNGR